MKTKNLADPDDFDKILAEMRGDYWVHCQLGWEENKEMFCKLADRIEKAVKQRVSNAYHRGCREYGKYFLAKIRCAITNCAKNEGLNHD